MKSNAKDRTVLKFILFLPIIILRHVFTIYLGFKMIVSCCLTVYKPLLDCIMLPCSFIHGTDQLQTILSSCILSILFLIQQIKN